MISRTLLLLTLAVFCASSSVSALAHDSQAKRDDESPHSRRHLPRVLESHRRSVDDPLSALSDRRPLLGPKSRRALAPGSFTRTHVRKTHGRRERAFDPEPRIRSSAESGTRGRAPASLEDVPDAVPARNELRAILAAGSVAELDSQDHFGAKLRYADDECRAQLKSRLIPSACFQRIALESNKLDGVGRLTRADDRRRLARLCLENARKSRSRIDLEASLVSTSLPYECRAQARERLEDLRYADEAERPEESVIRTTGTEIED